MAAALHEHNDPDRFIAGTVGLPGERTFYLQAKSGRRLTSVVVEKEQVAILAERIAELLDLVHAKHDSQGDIPESAPPQMLDNGELATPIDPEFRVGTMSLSWDGSLRRVVVECFAMGEGEEDESGEADALRVVIDAGRAREFVRRSEQVLDAGRGDCPLCSLPLGSTGHLCPRANGVPR